MKNDEERIIDLLNRLVKTQDEANAAKEENTRLRAAVEQMKRMLPVLEYLRGGPTWKNAIEGEDVSIYDYRQALEIALAKRNEP